MITPQDKELLMQKRYLRRTDSRTTGLFRERFSIFEAGCCRFWKKEFWLLQQMSKSSISMHGTLIPGQIRL